MDTAGQSQDRFVPRVEELRRRHRDLDPATAAEIDVEAELWEEILGLVELLTPQERLAPGYFRDPDWSVKDLLAHFGSWHAVARSELVSIATRMYEPHDFDIERRNAATLAGHRDESWDHVLRRAIAARAWLLEAWIGLGGRSATANRWVRKAGAEHYGEHIDRLRDWTLELISLRGRPMRDERDP